MAYRPSLFNFLAQWNRRDLLVAREKLAREESRATSHVNDLRDLLDSMSNELAQRGPIDPVRTAQLITAAGDKARAGAPVKLPPRGSAARLIVLAGMRARGEKDVPNE
jgi:hypothetical protein